MVNVQEFFGSPRYDNPNEKSKYVDRNSFQPRCVCEMLKDDLDDLILAMNSRFNVLPTPAIGE